MPPRRKSGTLVSGSTPARGETLEGSALSTQDRLRKKFEAALERDAPIELRDLILEVALECEDQEWAECCCAQLAKHRNANVRGDALLGLGHLARRFGRLDRNRVKRLVEIGLHAHNEYVRERAESAADDLETFLSWSFDRPPSTSGSSD